MIQLAYFVAGTLLLILPNVVSAQQEKGDKELGLGGAATVSNSSPVSGNVFAEISFGKYFEENQYLGIYAAPLFSFGGDSKAGAVGIGGEYRYLFGHRNSRLWPFVGVQGGDALARSDGSWSNGASIAPELGVKFYASPKTAFEVSYLLLIQFNGGTPYAGFGDRSENLIVFGFKHIF